MKRGTSLMVLIAFVAIMGLSGCGSTDKDNDAVDRDQQNQTEYYQLKTYSFNTNEQLKLTEEYLQQAYLPALKRLGFRNLGVFKTKISDTSQVQQVFVLIPFAEFDKFLTIEKELAKDQAYLDAGADYQNAKHDLPPYARIESTILQAFDGMPQMKPTGLTGPREQRVYELRSYESATEAIHNMKVDMFNAGGEIKLFESLDFNAVFYAKVISGAHMPNLMYMITFSDEKSQGEHWEAFIQSPTWTALKEIAKYKNTVSHIDKYLLYPTEYSDY